MSGKLNRGSTVLLCGLLMLTVAGCGVYTLNPKGKSTIKTISVEPFENNTAQFGFTDRLAELLTDAFISDGTLKVVPSSGADAMLVGTLLVYNRAPLRFDQNEQVAEYKVHLEFEISLKNPRDQSEYWKDRMTQEGTYDAASETEEDGQKRAMEKLVTAILNRTTKSW